MGGIVSHNGKPIAYWRKKLSSAQQKYPKVEQELLAVVKILKELRTMLHGQRLKIYTYHKNPT